MRFTKTITVNYSNQLNSTSCDVYAFSLACISKVQVHAPRGCVSRCYAPANDIFAAIYECNEPLTHPKSAYMHESRENTCLFSKNFFSNCLIIRGCDCFEVLNSLFCDDSHVYFRIWNKFLRLITIEWIKFVWKMKVADDF